MLWVKVVRHDQPTPPPRTLDQVEKRWFVGAHADVGGGYADGILAQVPLHWLMQKTQAHGLIFRDAVVIDGDEVQGQIHDSFAEMAGGAYRALKFFRPYYRAIGVAPVVTGDVTTTTINETIDASVFERCRSDSTYRPQNLLARARSRGLAQIQGSVRADDPTVAVS